MISGAERWVHEYGYMYQLKMGQFVYHIIYSRKHCQKCAHLLHLFCCFLGILILGILIVIIIIGVLIFH